VLLLGRRAAALLPAFASWVDSLGVWGPLAFAAGYVLATLAFVPGSLLTLAAGAIFGVWQGALLVFLCATLGASAAFLLGRSVARAAVERRLKRHPRFAAIDRAVAKNGLRTVLLLRLSPVFPFNLLNYALGLTSVRFGDFLVGSIGMIPGTLLYASLGRGLGSLAAIASGVSDGVGATGNGRTALFVAGLGATALVVILVGRAARRALAEAEIPDSDGS
jgi:uncharacterized membrane protein YdjX (TVP38/TMEM64 family)